MATPKGNRRKDVFGGLPRLPGPTVSTAAEPDGIPPSSTLKVPSSVPRHSIVQAENTEPRLPMTHVRPTIEQTPTRGPSKHGKSLIGTTHSNGPSSVFFTPSKPRRSLDSMLQPSRRINMHSYAMQTRPSASHEEGYSEPAIQETPQKRSVGAAEPSRSFDSTAPLLDTSPPNVGPNTQEHGVLPNMPSSPPVLEEASSNTLYETLGWDDYIDEIS